MSLHNNTNTGHLVFGTVVRNAPVLQGGELVLLDWKTKRIVRRTPVFPENPRMDDDPNPRGNTRGCKGITIIGNEIIAANFHTLKVFDFSLNHIRDFSHGLMVGMHETYNDSGKRIWVTSTVIDAALEYDLSTNKILRSYCPREMEAFQSSLNLEPSGFDMNVDNRRRFLTDDHLESKSHLHLNAVTVNNGDVYALFHRFGAICNLSTGKVVVKDKRLVRGHNLIFLNNETVVTNDTYGQTVRIYDIVEGQQIKEIDLLEYDWVRRLKRRAELSNFPRKVLGRLGIRKEMISRPIFVRGMARKGDIIYVGLSPASILCINWRSGELLDTYQYSSNPRVCVHGLAILP